MLVFRMRSGGTGAEWVRFSVCEFPGRIQPPPVVRNRRADGTGIPGADRSQPRAAGPENHPDHSGLPASSPVPEAEGQVGGMGGGGRETNVGSDHFQTAWRQMDREDLSPRRTRTPYRSRGPRPCRTALRPRARKIPAQGKRAPRHSGEVPPSLELHRPMFDQR